MITLPEIKKGDSFSYSVTWEGAAANELKSQIKDKYGTLVAEATIEDAETAGTFVISVPDTSNWPVGTLQTDIRRTIEGMTQTSATFYVTVAKGVTE